MLADVEHEAGHSKEHATLKIHTYNKSIALLLILIFGIISETRWRNFSLAKKKRRSEIQLRTRRVQFQRL